MSRPRLTFARWRVSRTTLAIHAASVAGHTIGAVIFMIFLFCSGPAVRAADDAGSFVAHGLGNRTCDAWIEARTEKSMDGVRMLAWALGFISAYNKYQHKGIDVTARMGDEDIRAAIDQHCKSRPFDSVAFATNALIERLVKSRGSTRNDGLMGLLRLLGNLH